MHALNAIHLIQFRVCPHDPQGQGADEGALDKGHNVDIPVEAGAGVEGRVYAGEEEARDGGRDDAVGDVVQDKGKGHLVEVQGECFEREVFGDGLDVLDQALGPREGEWIVHGGGEAWAGGGMNSTSGRTRVV